MDLRSRVSTTSMDPSLKSTSWWTQTLFNNVWPCIDRHSRLNILARGHRALKQAHCRSSHTLQSIIEHVGEAQF